MKVRRDDERSAGLFTETLVWLNEVLDCERSRNRLREMTRVRAKVYLSLMKPSKLICP